MKTASRTLLILLVTPLLSSCLDGAFNVASFRAVTGSGTIVLEKRTVSGFDHVSVSGSGELTLIQGDEESLTIETDDNLLPEIRSVVTDGHLKIGPDRVSLRPSGTIKYTLEFKNLADLELSGSLSATADHLSSPSLECGISGSGNIRIQNLEAEHFSVRISGSGSARATGKADRQEAHISGSGDYNASELAGKAVAIRISGSGKATVWAAEELDVRVSGSGNVGYYGSPRVSHKVSGSGSVRSLGMK